LVVARGVGTAGETGEVDERGASDVVGYGFEGELKGVAEKCEISGGFLVFSLFFCEKAGEGHDVSINLLFLNRRIFGSHDAGFGLWFIGGVEWRRWAVRSKDLKGIYSN